MNKFIYTPDTPAASKDHDKTAVELLADYTYLEAITDPKATWKFFIFFTFLFLPHKNFL